MKHRHDSYAWSFRRLPPPEDPLVKTLSLPDLWGRVHGFFARVLEHAGGPNRLRQQGLFGPQDRYEITGWLEPVERLVRMLLVAQAVIRLLMTPVGSQLLRETPKAMPGRSRPAADEIVEDPSPAAPQQLDEQSQTGSTERSAFHVLKWTPSEACDACPAPRRLQAKPYDEVPAVAGIPLQLHLSLARQTLKPPSRAALALARRIEALSRVIADPEPTIRRLARFLARLPHGLIDPDFGLKLTKNWFHCGAEYRRAFEHSERLIRVFNIFIEPG